MLPSMDVMIVEYFCDKERMQLHVQETKELQVCVGRHSTVCGGGGVGCVHLY